MHQEIENVGVQLGRRIIDVMSKDLPNVHQTQLDIIKYICEKIIAMREQPFIDAVDNLKRA